MQDSVKALTHSIAHNSKHLSYENTLLIFSKVLFEERIYNN